MIPEGARGDFLGATPSPDERREAERWKHVRMEIWEGSTRKLFPDQNLIDHFGEDHMALALARIECHYFMNNAFFDTDNYLIENVEKIRHIPAVIVQGRYDVVCPMMSAWDLYRAWPEADLRIIPDAGHSATEPGNISALVEATDRFRNLRWRRKTSVIRGGFSWERRGSAAVDDRFSELGLPSLMWRIKSRSRSEE